MIFISDSSPGLIIIVFIPRPSLRGVRTGWVFGDVVALFEALKDKPL